jgi:hypothetical protein
MDNETRGIIQRLLDDTIKNLQKGNGSISITSWFNDDVLIDDKALDWLDADSKKLTSELATGYIIGYMVSSAHSLIEYKRMKENCLKLTNDELQQYLKMTDKEKIRFLKVDVTKDEVKEIRDMIKPKIEAIRTEVYRALGK